MIYAKIVCVTRKWKCGGDFRGTFAFSALFMLQNILEPCVFFNLCMSVSSPSLSSYLSPVVIYMYLNFPIFQVSTTHAASHYFPYLYNKKRGIKDLFITNKQMKWWCKFSFYKSQKAFWNLSQKADEVMKLYEKE